MRFQCYLMSAATLIFISSVEPAQAQIRNLRHAHDIIWTAMDQSRARSNILGIPSSYEGSGCESTFITRVPFVTRQSHEIRWGRVRSVSNATNSMLGNGPHLSLAGSFVFEEDGVRERASSLVIFFSAGDVQTRDRLYEAAVYLKEQCAPY